MKLRLDKSGRVVLPKPLRQRLGLRAGTMFEATEAGDGVLLRPLKQRPSLVEQDGFLVHTGQAMPLLTGGHCLTTWSRNDSAIFSANEVRQ